MEAGTKRTHRSKYFYLGAFVLLSLIMGCEEEQPQWNHAPEIQSYGPLGIGVAAGQIDTLVCFATDEDGDSLTYTWFAPVGPIYGSGDTVFWVAPEEVSLYPIYCRVEDGKGGYAEASCNIQVFPNMLFSENVWTFYTTINSGLDNEYLWTVAIDGNDEVWTGDDNGLLTHFDGLSWKSWRIHQDELISIDFDSQNNVWMCAAGVVSKFSAGEISYYESQRRYANSIAIDSEENIWVAYPGEGLSKFDGSNWIHFDSLGLPSPWGLAIDNNNHIWYTADSGLVQYDHTDWIVHEGPTPRWQGSIAIDSQNRIWMATNSNDLALFDHTGWKFFPSPFPSGDLNSIVIDNADNIWCSYDSGIAILNGRLANFADFAAWQTILTPDNSPLPQYGQVSSLAFDSKGDVWGTLYYSGLFKITLADE